MSELKTNLQEILQEKQEKIIPENIKKDVQIFDVVGTLEGGTTTSGVKLFETEEEMQADSTAQEGDLAVVYREEIQNMTADTQTQYITFPETVTLPEAFAGEVYCMLRAVDESGRFDGQVMLDANMFRFDGYSETGMIRVGYQSEDGITYNRDIFAGDSGDLTNPVDLGTIVQVYRSGEWNDILGYFMQVGGNVFDGLYQGKEVLDYNYIYGLGNIVSSDDITYTENTLIEISNVIDTILENSELGISTLCFKTNNILYVLRNMNKLYNIVGEIGFRLQSQHGNSEQNIECVTINMDTLEVTQSPLTIDTNYASINGDTKWYMSFDVFNNIDYAFVLYGDSDGNIHASNINIRTLENNTLNYTTVVDFTCYFKSFIAYKFANNQFTLTSPNQLLPGISAYGKNGNVIGDGTIYDNIPKQDYLDKLCNINAVEGTGQYAIASQTGAILQPNKLYGCNVADTIDNANMTIAKNTIISQIGNYSDRLKTIKSLYGVNYIVRDNYVYYLSSESNNAVIYKLDKKLNTVERHAFLDAQLESYVAMDVVDNIMYISSNLGERWKIIACNISNDTSSVIYSGSLSLSPRNDIRIKVSNGHIYIFHAETYTSISSQNRSKLHIKECDISGNNMKTLFDYTPGINVDKFAITSDDKYVIITDIDGETGYIFDIDAKSSRKLSFVGKPQKLCVLPIDDTFIYMIGDTDIYKININDTTVTKASISNEILIKMRSTYYINGKWYTDLNSELYNVNILSDTSTKLSMPWLANDYLPNKDDSETNFSSVQLQQSYDIIQNNNIVDIYALSASNKTKGIIKLSLLNLALDKIDIWNLPKMIITGSTNDNIPVVLCDNLASLSQAEYNTALNTAKQIEGEEEIVNE